VAVEADTTYYIYDGMNVVAELDGSLDLQSKYVYANGMLVGNITSDNKLYQYFHDGLGSITMISDSTGEYQNLYVYDDFGNFRMMEEAGSVPNSYYYTGQERDENPSGLYNLRARYYAAGIGRFTQEDPLLAVLDVERIQEFNGYTYVSNDPINNVDPLGLFTFIVMPDPDLLYDYSIHPENYDEMLKKEWEFDKCFFGCLFGFDALVETGLFSAAGSSYAGRRVAGVWYHYKYPKWFSAWGTKSEVYVPLFAKNYVKFFEIIGWAWTAYDVYRCYNKCQNKDEKKSPVHNPEIPNYEWRCGDEK
jgi:RHS repeat-associated protein